MICSRREALAVLLPWPGGGWRGCAEGWPAWPPCRVRVPGAAVPMVQSAARDALWVLEK